MTIYISELMHRVNVAKVIFARSRYYSVINTYMGGFIYALYASHYHIR